MAASTPLWSVVDVESFINEYYDAWSGTDEDLIMSYYAENVVLQIPGTLMQGKEAVREQFVRPFITAFPGNHHRVRSPLNGVLKPNTRGHSPAMQRPVLELACQVAGFMSTIRRTGRSLRVAFTSMWGRYCKPSRICR